MPEEYKIVLNAQTNLYEVVDKAGRSIDELKAKTEALNRSMDEQRRKQEQMGETTKKTSNAMGELAVGIGKAFDVVAIEEFLRRSFLAFSQMQEGLTRIQNATGATKREMDDFKESLSRMSTISGESFGKLTESFGEFLSVTRLGYEDAKKVFMGINENARLAGVSVQEMSRNTQQALAQLQIPANEVNEVLGELVTKFAGVANKEFIRDMPRLIEQMHQMGVEGKEAVQGVANSLATMTMAMGSQATASKGLNAVIEQMGHSHSMASRAMLNDIGEVMNTTKDLGQALEVAYKNYLQLGVYDKDFVTRTVARDRMGVTGEQAEAVKAYHETRLKILESMDSEDEKQRKLNALLHGSQTALQGLMAQVENIADKVGSLLDKIGVTRALQDFAKIIDDIGKGVDYINERFEKNAKLIEGIGKALTLPGWAKLPSLLANAKADTQGAAGAAGVLPGMQHGGIVNSPTIAMIGEAGPEAVIPLGRGGGGNGDRHTEDNTTAIKELTNLLRDSMRDSGGGGRGRPFGGGGGDGGGGYYGGGYSGDDYAGGSEGGGYGTSDGGSGGGAGGGSELASAEVGEDADAQFGGPLGTLGAFKARPYAYTPGAEEEPWSAVAGHGQAMGGGPLGRAIDPSGRGSAGGAGYGRGGFRPGIGGRQSGPGGRSGTSSSSSSSDGPAAPGTAGGPAIDMRSARMGMNPMWDDTKHPATGYKSLAEAATPHFGNAPDRPGWDVQKGTMPFPPDAAAAAGAAGKGINRDWAAKELAQKPWLKDKIMKIAVNEAGGNMEVAQSIFESLLNRAEMHGTSIEKEATWKTDGGYYDDRAHPKQAGALDNAQLKAALEGTLNNVITKNTNASNYATENASGDFAKGEIRRGEFEQRSKHGEEYFMAPSSTKSGWQSQYKKWLADKQSAPEPVAPATASSGAGGAPGPFGGYGPYGMGPGGSGVGGGSADAGAGEVPGHPLGTTGPRERHLSGILEFAGQTYRWGSGGQGGGSAPPGTYAVNIGNMPGLPGGTPEGGVGKLGASGWGGKLDPAVAGISSTQYKGNTSGFEIHQGSGGDLDHLYSAGCFAIHRDDWKRLRDNLLAQAKTGKLILTFDKNGMAVISHKDKGAVWGPNPVQQSDDNRAAVAKATGRPLTKPPPPPATPATAAPFDKPATSAASKADEEAKAAAARAAEQKKAAEARKRKKDRDVTQSKDFSKSKSRQAKRDTERDAHENSVIDY